MSEYPTTALWGLIAIVVTGVLFLVAFIGWLHEHDLHPFRRISDFLHKPWTEVALLLFAIGGIVQYGATKGFLGGGPQMAPRMTAVLLPTVSSENGISSATMFPAYTNAVTNLCFTGIMLSSTSAYLRAAWPTGVTLPDNALEIYARPDLTTNGWEGIGIAAVAENTDDVVVELPRTLLPDGWASSMFFMLGLCTDTDGDGLSDSFENLVAKTDPDLADTDGDGLPDGWEYGMGLDPLSGDGNDGAAADADGDGFSNSEEYAYGSHPFLVDTDNDGLDDRQEIGQVEELRGADFLWFDTTGHESALGTASSYNSVKAKVPLPFGIEINGMCHTNAQIDLDGLVTLIHPDRQSESIGSGYPSSGGMSNRLWSANHVTIAAYNTDVYARPRITDWGSAFTHGTVMTNGAAYSVIEYRNVSHYNLGSSTSARMTFQVILPANETNVVYVSYLNVDDAIPALDRSQNFGVQLPATNCVPGRGTYANVSWNKYSGCFAQPMTLKYTLGTGTNPAAADVDDDGLDDPAEMFVYHTDPYRTDTDGDGLDDGREAELGTDANRADTDGDGMEDGWEVQFGTNPLADDAEEDPDWDGLPNIWEQYNGTDPHDEDTDGDMLADSLECGWIENGVTNIPWFAVQPILTYAPTNDVDRALIGCAMPFANRLAGSRIDTVLADVNGVVYFGRPDTTNSLSSSNSGANLSEKQNKLASTVAAYWTDLKMRPELGSSIVFGTATKDATNRFFVIEYRDVGTYAGNGNRISFQMSIPESEPNLVYVRYGAITDARTNYRVSIGAQGGKVGVFANTPLLSHHYQNRPPTIEAGRTVAFHFGAGSDPLEADTDEDGLDDRVEHIIGTNSRNTDTDGDGFDDRAEVEYGMSPVSSVGADGADGDFDGDGLPNAQEVKFGTLLNVADCDGDGLPDGEETGYIAVSNDLPWLTFDQYEDCTTDLVYQTHSQYHVNRGLPCALTIQGELVTNITFTSRGWLFFNKAGLEDKWRGNGSSDFTYKIDADTLAIAAYGYSMFVATNAAERSTVVRYGTATHDGVGYVVIEYDNLYYQLSSSTTNSISFQIALPTNTADRVCVRYRNVTGTSMNGRYCGIGMQTFGGKWLHSYCYCTADKVYEGLGLQFSFGRNTAPLERDSDGDGLADGEEIELGTSPRLADTDGDGMPDGWEREYELDPLSADGDDGAWGDADGDGLPNGKECEYGTNPLLADTDGDGLADGQEVVDTFENPTIPWVTLSSPTDLTDAFSNELECVNYALPSPIQMQRETVTNITIDAHGVIYLNQAGYANNRSAHGSWSLDYEIDEQCAVIAPYWSDLELADVIGPSSIKVGQANIGTNICLIVEYANMYYRTYREDETNAISFQVAIPMGSVDRISVKYADLVGERMDGRNAVIGFQTFGFRDYSEYCDYDYDSVADGTGVVFLMGYGTDPKRTDTDRDGLTDGNEVLTLGSDPCVVDTDGDGIADGVEVEIGTSPIDADSDDDGLNDGWERDNGLDPLSAAGDDGANGDPDNDGLTNIQEQTHGGDPNKADTDGDGLNDGREVALGTGVAVADTDGDGLSDGDEDSRGTNPTLSDSDGDGLSDGWEVANNFNPLTPSGTTGEASDDTDGDGITNLQEMLRGSNPRQADTDGDGISDGAEVTLGTSPIRADTDGDGISDSREVTLGLDPSQPDSDGDGMNDGWEYEFSNYGFNPSIANPNNAPSRTGPHDDLDGDGLTNAEECSFGTNPGIADTDGDGVNDGHEVTNCSDPTDRGDEGKANSRRRVRFYFGDDSGSHSEKYRLSITPVSGPSGDTMPSSFTWINENYGQGEWKTAMLKSGWKYRVQLQWISCNKPRETGWYPNYDYTLKYETDACCIIKDDPSSLFRVNYFGEEYYGLFTFPVLNCEAHILVVDIEHELLWETANKANQIFNPTPKDDFTEEGENEFEGNYTYSAHRDYLYVVSDPKDKTYNVTEQIKPLGIPDEYAGKVLCAAFDGAEPVPGSTVPFSPEHKASMYIKEKQGLKNEYSIRAGIDVNGDGKLSYDESVPLEVYKYRGKPKYAVVCGTPAKQYSADDEYIGGKISGPIGIAVGGALPYSKSFLSIFYNGNDDNISEHLKTTTKPSTAIHAFSNCLEFAEWLTHNSGAKFNEDGYAQIKDYQWGPESQMAQFMAQRKPLAPWQPYVVNAPVEDNTMSLPRSYYIPTSTGNVLLKFFKDNVRPYAVTQLADSEDGTTLTVRATSETWTDEALEKLVFGERNKVIPESTTQEFGIKGPYQGIEAVAAALGASALTGGPQIDELDAFLAIGRGRLLAPAYTFTVRKTTHLFREPTYDLISIGFTCTISDLYDFNYDDGALSRHAAVLQIGYGRGSYNRQHGQIFRHQIKINTTYHNPFIQ